MSNDIIYDGIAAIIPVYNPEPGLLSLCKSLRTYFATVIVVDDGSVEDLSRFDLLPPDVRFLRHDLNRGKGAAIKTALGFVNAMPEIKGVVLVDGDGQHLPKDVVAVVERMIETNNVTLGVRNFSSRDIPFRSRFGNKMTVIIMRLLLGQRLTDTQTGLRALPRRLLSDLMALSGQRYEYEMQMLGHLASHGEIIEQVPIATVYIDSNRSSHFRPLRDSAVIYASLLRQAFSRVFRFMCSSVAAFIADNTVFSVMIYIIGERMSDRSAAIFVSLATARVTSALLNFWCNKKYVFNSGLSARFSLPRYATLAVAIASLSWLGTTVVSNALSLRGLPITLAKIVVEGVLFILSYKLQSKWVFASGENAYEKQH